MIYNSQHVYYIHEFGVSKMHLFDYINTTNTSTVIYFEIF